MGLSLQPVVDFGETGPVVATEWAPSTDTYGRTVPILSVKASSNYLGWFPAFSSQPNAERVRNVQPTKLGGFRVDLDTYPNELSIFFRRPTPRDGYKKGLDWMKEQQLSRAHLDWQTSQQAEFLRQSIPDTKRDGLFVVSYWGAYDFRYNRWVPAGIVVPLGSSAQWIPLPGWEALAEDHNDATRSGPGNNPMAFLLDLAERTTGSHNETLSYPEYVRASSEEDAARIAMVRQRVLLIKILGNGDLD